ncbi:MAG: SusD/RagB family nutrient-binding outer membrane lipoprotein [Bacteroidales bacterium]|nr:SusD/RagB family nutrient-binding outer membrane lipoprotein [Bacteroidales bacterium]
MKNKFLKLSLIFALAVAFTSCNLFPDPEEPQYEEELNALIPSAQYLVAYFSGTDHSRFQLQWSQQLAGVRGVHLSVDRYNMTGDHSNEVWSLFYQNIIPTIGVVLNHANQLEAPAYKGMARILRAYNIGLMTDAWGDIPNMSALFYSQGAYPAYDNQAEIYLHIIDELNGAITDLNNAATAAGPVPSQHVDLIYGGDLEKWKKAANVIKLRYILRIAHHAGEYDLALPFLNPASLFSSNQDDMKYQFHGNQINPFFYYENVVRNTRMGNYYVEKLKETNDPRLPVFIRINTANNEYVGSAPGEANFNASFIGSQIAGEQAPVSFITYVEQKFIEAELYFRIGQQAMADQAFEQAVKASLQRYGVSNPAWEAQYAELENVTLEQIISAKYLALFLNPEVWSDFRRTGYPALTPYPDAPIEETEEPQIPRHFLYPSSEVVQNPSNVPAGVTIYTRMWWDVER